MVGVYAILIVLAGILGVNGLVLALTMLRPSHRDLVDKTISMMENVDAWTFSSCTAKHDSGLSIWIANMPILDLAFYKPCEMKLRCTDAFRLSRALSTLRSRKLGNAFSKIGK
jgi:hypothetical protein